MADPYLVGGDFKHEVAERTDGLLVLVLGIVDLVLQLGLVLLLRLLEVGALRIVIQAAVLELFLQMLRSTSLCRPGGKHLASASHRPPAAMNRLVSYLILLDVFVQRGRHGLQVQLADFSFLCSSVLKVTAACKPGMLSKGDETHRHVGALGDVPSRSARCRPC